MPNLPNTFAQYQNYTQLSLPEGAKARIGKGQINEIAYSSDGKRLAVASSIGIWIYDAESGKELDLLTGHTSVVLSLSFSPDGQTLASGSHDGTVLLWHIMPPSPPELSEDLNKDGVVNIIDLVSVASNFGKTGENDADVNTDGVVNIQDLVLVASNFGQMGENIADVNGDGVVNITDLVKVAGALGNAAAAPSLHPQLLETLTASDVHRWLIQAQHLNLMDATSQRGIRFLEQLLEVLIPKETTLLPNYPNPFNPETWIPYQLAKSADVILTIYAVNGQMVRQLPLGHQPAGMYQIVLLWL